MAKEDDLHRVLSRAQKAVEELSGFPAGVSMDVVFQRNWEKCYDVDNAFAYNKDLHDEKPCPGQHKRMMANLKTFNFVPTYDKWCLFCDKHDVTKRCKTCRHIYFCDKYCQREALPIHKNHCGRDLFTRCATCGSKNLLIKCPDCPIRWCSGSCREKHVIAHMEFDCANLKRLFC